MSPDGIVEPVDIAANGLVGFLAGVEDGPPDELGFQGLKERLHHGVVVAISLAGHRDQDAVLAELGLIVDRERLAATIRMVDQPCCRTAHGQGFAQSGESQVAMQPIACCPADDPACEQVDDDGEIQPAFTGPHVGDVGAPLLVGPYCREVLIQQVRRDRPGVMAVRGSLEPPLLPSPQAVVAHQPGYSAATAREAALPHFPRHSGAAIGAVRQGKGRPNMCQQHHVVTLATAGWPTSPGEIAALADTKHAAQAMDGEFRFRPIDEREPHRLPSRAKKAVAFFRMSRSCRRISFSRRSRFSSAATSLAAADGATARRSRLRPIQRTSVDSPIPRSPAISRCVRPLVCTRRTASSSNSFVTRCACVIEFLIAHRELSTFPQQVQRTAASIKSTPPTLTLPDKPSIAVLPFQNMSGDPEQEYFVDGMVEEITTALSRIRWLFVIARNSSFTYKGQAIDIKQVGRELGVRYVLEGSVRKATSHVRITAQLIEAESGAHLWADRF